MSVEFSSKVAVPPKVLMRRLEDESVLLNLDSERYYGLDEVGTQMLDTLCASDSLEAAFGSLAGEYDVDPQTLRDDLLVLAQTLVDQGLLQVLG